MSASSEDLINNRKFNGPSISYDKLNIGLKNLSKKIAQELRKSHTDRHTEIWKKGSFDTKKEYKSMRRFKISDKLLNVYILLLKTWQIFLIT